MPPSSREVTKPEYAAEGDVPDGDIVEVEEGGLRSSVGQKDRVDEEKGTDSIEPGPSAVQIGSTTEGITEKSEELTSVHTSNENDEVVAESHCDSASGSNILLSRLEDGSQVEDEEMNNAIVADTVLVTRPGESLTESQEMNSKVREGSSLPASQIEDRSQMEDEEMTEETDLVESPTTPVKVELDKTFDSGPKKVEGRTRITSVERCKWPKAII